MTQQGVSIKVHTRLTPAWTLVPIDMDEVWRLAIPVNLHGIRSAMFSAEYQLLIIAQQLDTHFRLGKFQMTGFYDLVNLAATNPFEIDWNRLIDSSIKNNSFLQILEYIAILIYKFKVKSFGDTPDLENSKLYLKIFNDVLESGVCKLTPYKLN